MLYCPYFFRPGVEKCCTVTKKPKKPILQNLQAWEALKVLENRFFRFFRGSTALFNEKPKKLGTVQHFCNPEEQKCCTVPEFLCLGTKNLRTVQHFCNPEEQKSCTVPKFFCPGTKNLGTVQHFCSLQSRGAKVLYCPYFPVAENIFLYEFLFKFN